MGCCLCVASDEILEKAFEILGWRFKKGRSNGDLQVVSILMAKSDFVGETIEV